MDRRRNRLLHLEASPAAPGLARSAVRQLLAGRDPDVIERALLITSEAVTNAVIHAAAAITIEALVANDTLRVMVEDGNDDMPTAGAPRGARGGFGMHIIDELADSWGVAPRDDGKAVWFEISLAPAHEPHPADGADNLSNARY
jgi:anti-sigma regulatory factor (Ser/Thr protein kinase)